MNQIPKLTILSCACILLWITACTTDHYKSNLLSDAIQAVDKHPQEALKLLEGISPEYLHDSDKDKYMQYVVILTQARYMDYQDITGDSLILDAQRYFARTRNYEMAARAGYYAAIYWYEGDAGDKAVEYWQAAFDFAEKAGNKLFMAKSAYSLGTSYYNQEQWDDAFPHCLKALELYKNKPNAQRYHFSIIDMLGHIYYKQDNFDQAYSFFDNGLETAKNFNDIKYVSRFLRKKGIIHHDKGEFRQAKEYFDQALSIQSDPEDRIRTFLSYARLYRTMNLPDSAFHYLNIIEDGIREITYPNTRRDIYAELVTYYKSNQGDGDKIALYSQLAHAEDLQIKKSLNEKKIIAMTQQLEQLKQKNRTVGQTYRRLFDYGLIVMCLLAAFLAAIWFTKRLLKEKYTKIKRKYWDVYNLQFTQTVDELRFLLAGLENIAENADYLYQTEPAYIDSPVWGRQLELLNGFSTQLARYAKIKLEKMPRSSKALPDLTTEDLAILQLSRFRYTDENIGRMLGHTGDTKESVTLRKEYIRRILTEAGMSDEELSKTFFILESS